MNRLRVTIGLPEPMTFRLAGTRLSVGRTEDNDIVLPHPTVSSHHATLMWDGETYRLTDLDSKNGTMVNGELVTGADLRPGTVLRFGDVQAMFEIDRASHAAPNMEQSREDRLSISASKTPPPRRTRQSRLQRTIIWGLGGCIVVAVTVALFHLRSPVRLKAAIEPRTQPIKVLSWEVVDRVTTDPLGGSFSLRNTARQQGFVIAIIRARIAWAEFNPRNATAEESENLNRPRLGNRNDDMDPAPRSNRWASSNLWSVSAKAGHFKVISPDRETTTATAFDTFGRAMQHAGDIEMTLVGGLDFMEVSAVFVVKSNLLETGALRFQYKDLPPLDLGADLRRRHTGKP